MISLETSDFKCLVSTVLNKDVKQHGKQFMFDNCHDTAWSSDQGEPQWIIIKLNKLSTISGIQLQFQGGFVSLKCEIIFTNSDNVTISESIYPSDNNKEQIFHFNNSSLTNINNIKMNLLNCSDFFGRIIIYKMQILKLSV